MSKKKRKNKQGKKRVKKRALRKNKQNNKKSSPNTSAPVFHMMENPLANLSDEERKQSVEEMGRRSKRLFQESLTKLQEILKQYDGITLLSILSAYGLTAGLGNEGVNPRIHSNPLDQSHVEICQALLLQVNPNESRCAPVTPDVVQQVWDPLIDITQSFGFRRMTGKLVDEPEEQAAVILLQEWVRGNTQIVRNWGYYSQVKNISKELYSSFDRLLFEKIGFRASDVIDIFDYMISSIERALSARMNLLAELYRIKKPEALVYKYYEIIDQSLKEAESFIENFSVRSAPIKSVFAMLLSHYDLRLYKIYIFYPNNMGEA